MADQGDEVVGLKILFLPQDKEEQLMFRGEELNIEAHGS